MIVAVKPEFLKHRKAETNLEVEIISSDIPVVEPTTTSNSLTSPNVVIEAEVSLQVGMVCPENEVLKTTLKRDASEAFDLEETDNKKNTSGGNCKQKITGKHRKEKYPSKDERLCSFIVRGELCPYSNNCQYSHDPIVYLSTKKPDLGERCYQYDTFGYCTNGITCRFGDSHIDRATGTNIKRSAELGGVIERINVNILKKDIQYILRKKQYDQHLKATKAKKSADSQKADTVPQINDSSLSSVPAAPQVDPLPTGPDSTSATVLTSAEVEATGTAAVEVAPKSRVAFDPTPYPDGSGRVKLVDFANKVYVAPLTTVGNLPFRRILKHFGADITCGEMAMASNIQEGQASEWALLRRHPSEDVFGVQLAGNAPELMGRVSRILDHETSTDFVDLNCGCPIDVVCDRGSGSALLRKHNKLLDIVNTMANNLRSRQLTVKLRTGWDDKTPSTHKLVPLLQKASKGRIAAIFIHGRSRTQRYAKLANWEYVLQAAQSQDPSLPRIPIIGNGDILSWEDWHSHQRLLESHLRDEDPEAVGLCSCAMLARGALIKPWLPTEIKESRHVDMAASQRLDMLKMFCNFGLEHWGSDQQGVNTTRRFLLEWLSFLHRYTPVGLLESTQTMNQRPPQYFGRCDLETLMGSSNSTDWVRISEMLLGPVPEDFSFQAKHKSNSYAAEEMVSNG